MSVMTINLTPELYNYYQKIGYREPAILQELRAATQQYGSARMQISPEQGQFMALLMKLMNAKKTLEVGTFTGYSALSVALALPADGKIIACDVSEEWTSMARKFWEKAGITHKVDLRIGPALNTLQALIDNGESNTFDFVFIDADKQNYVNYYEFALKLLRTGGLIAIDNVLWSGAVADLSVQDKNTKALRALNEFIYQDQRVQLSMLPIGDGLTLAMKV